MMPLAMCCTATIACCKQVVDSTATERLDKDQVPLVRCAPEIQKKNYSQFGVAKWYAVGLALQDAFSSQYKTQVALCHDQLATVSAQQ